MKMTMDLENMPKQDWIEYIELCGWALARAHARTGDAAQIAGYLGKNDTFDQAIAIMPIRPRATTRSSLELSALDAFQPAPTLELDSQNPYRAFAVCACNSADAGQRSQWLSLSGSLR
jgi:hypothetical protein